MEDIFLSPLKEGCNSLLYGRIYFSPSRRGYLFLALKGGRIYLSHLRRGGPPLKGGDNSIPYTVLRKPANTKAVGYTGAWFVTIEEYEFCDDGTHRNWNNPDIQNETMLLSLKEGRYFSPLREGIFLSLTGGGRYFFPLKADTSLALREEIFLALKGGDISLL